MLNSKFVTSDFNILRLLALANVLSDLETGLNVENGLHLLEYLNDLLVILFNKFRMRIVIIHIVF